MNLWAYDKEVIEPCLFESGILSIIKRIAMVNPDDSYGAVVRSTGSLEMDTVSLKFNRSDWDWFKNLYAIAGVEYEQPRRIEDALVILTRSGMKMAAVSLANVVHREVWKGDDAKNSPEFRTKWPKGFQIQIENEYRKDDLDVTSLVPHLEMVESQLFAVSHKMGLHPVEWAIVTHPLLWYQLQKRKEQFVNDRLWLNRHPYQLVEDGGVGFTAIEDTQELFVPVYFIPVSTNDDEKGTFYYYADARLMIDRIPEKDRFWTDAGLYVWEMEQCKWDYQLLLWHTYKPVITVPELAAVIPDVRISPPEDR